MKSQACSGSAAHWRCGPEVGCRVGTTPGTRWFKGLVPAWFQAWFQRPEPPPGTRANHHLYPDPERSFPDPNRVFPGITQGVAVLGLTVGGKTEKMVSYGPLSDMNLSKGSTQNIETSIYPVTYRVYSYDIVDNRTDASDAIVAGCLAGSAASILCCTIL